MPQPLRFQAIALLLSSVLLAACGERSAPADEPANPSVTASEPAAPLHEIAAAEGPPLGKYVCRQHMTTMGYLTLEEGGSYEVSGVRGRYNYDPETGGVRWGGGSYDEWGWDGTYDYVTRPEEDGRPDEHVIRLVSEGDGLKINCYKMAEE